MPGSFGRSLAGAARALRTKVRGLLRDPARRRIALIAGGAASILVAVAAGLSGPLARAAVRSRAEALGLHVEIDQASVGFGVVRLRGITVSVPEVPGFRARFEHVEVVPTPTLSVGRIAVHGGKVTLVGSSEELESGFDAYRAARGKKPRAGGSSTTTPVVFDGVDVAWRPGAEGARFAWGLGYERAADGREAISADLVRFALAEGAVELRGARLDTAREGERRVVVHASASGASATIDLDARSRGIAASPPGGDVTAAGVASPPPRGKAAAAEARGKKAAPASPAPQAPATPPGPDEDVGPALRARIGRAAARVASVLRPAAEVGLSGLHFEVKHAGQTLNVGPATLVASRDAQRLEVRLTSGPEAATALTLAAEVPLVAGPIDVEVKGGPISLAALGVKEHDMGLEDVERARLDVAGSARLDAEGRAVTLSGRASLDDLTIYSARLAHEPVRGLRLNLGGKAEIRTDGSRIALDGVEVGVGKIAVTTSGAVERGEGHARGELHVAVPLATCSDLFASVPPALLPLLAGLQTSGTFALSLDLAFDTRRPGDTKVTWDLANACRITRVPAALSPERFRGRFTRTVLGAGDVPTPIESGPGSPGWVPYHEISPFLATAVVVCEDARFFHHHGFDEKSIQDSVRDNLRAGRFVRGASTVSMQLAKNLYLAREKTLSRKLQEAVLTLLLEQTLTKEQILELYLNVIEFAPGVYGIGPAAEHYFRTQASELSLGQSLYLVSILPNPKNHHFKGDGSLSERWTEYLKKLMGIAHKIRRVTDAELEAGLAETIAFGVAAGETNGEPPADPDDDLGEEEPEAQEFYPEGP